MASIFGFITYPMEIGLIWLAAAVGSAGIGIILFTVFVRLVLSPLQVVQLRNAKAMQRLQPLMADIKQKHGKDREAASKATMELYKEHNVNPAMGCLPTLLQFPILIGLFYALLHLGQSPFGYPHVIWSKVTCNGHPAHSFASWLSQCYAINHSPTSVQHVFMLFHANFLWLNHGLGSPDPFYILPVLAGVAQWVQSRMMLTRSTDPQQQMMNTMTNFFPLMIVFFALRYPSGLSLYWVTSTLIGILIQFRITGWGLLPGALAPVTSLLGGPSSRAARPNSPPRRSSPSKPEVEPNGDGTASGDGTSSQNGRSTTARPRKRANRAKGGRGGGRRG